MIRRKFLKNAAAGLPVVFIPSLIASCESENKSSGKSIIVVGGGISGLAAGRKTETMSDTEIVNEVMNHLRDIYGSNIPEPKSMLRTKWQTNENTLGAYSYTAMGTEMRHFDDLATAINDKIFFAGEHTHIEYFSTVHGAYLSGLREADKIMAL